MNYLFMLLLFIQTANGQVTITVQDNQENPVANQTIEMKSEQGQALGNCATNANGRCTITLKAAPADASGFIRGAIVIAGRGQRPVIWPGGPLEISITLDPEGKVFVPSDNYITQTPQVTLTPSTTPTPRTTPIPRTTLTPRTTATPSTETYSGTQTPSLQETPENDLAPEDPESNTNFIQMAVQFIFIVIFIIIAALYIAASKRI